MPRRNIDPSLKPIALKFRKMGWSYKRIGKHLGVSTNGVYLWCNPEKRIERNKATRRYRQTEKGRRTNDRCQREYSTSDIGRITSALRNSRYAAQKSGHKPCIASREFLLTTLTDTCALCGLYESDDKHGGHRLHLDHDHNTGEFRGWLCRRCNTGLGFYEQFKSLAGGYLT